MRALVCREFAPLDALRIEDIAAPVPQPGEVVIDVEAASVNYPDALIVQGLYQVRPELPFIPGAELAGVVSAVGDGVTTPTIGTRVLGLPMRGAFAEQVALPATATLPLAENLAFSTAAAIPMTYGTAYHALADRAQLRAGETLLVLGAAGGIGTAAVELGKLMGATVIAAASSLEKLDVAEQHGADARIDYVREDLRARLNEITAGRGVDVVVDPVGGPFTEPALRAMSWGGRYLVVGFAAGEIPRIRLNLTLLKGCAIVGVYWGEFRRRSEAKSRADLARLLDYARDERIRPLVSTRYALAEAGHALADVYERRAVGKIVVEP